MSALDLRAESQKIQKYYFLSMGPREHPERRGATRSSTETPEVYFLAKMTKTPLVGPKTLILIWLLEQVETNAILKIIKFSFQRLFMGRNRS